MCSISTITYVTGSQVLEMAIRLGRKSLKFLGTEHLLFFSSASDRVFHRLKHQRNSFGSCEIRVGFMD